MKYNLTDGLNITTANDINSYSIGQLCRLLKRPPSEAVEAYLADIFQLKQNCAVPTLVHDLGKGLNAISDTLLPSFVFNVATREKSLMETQFGTWLPPGVSLQPSHESLTFMECFTDESYVHHRLEQLNIDMQVDPRLFEMKSRGGLNRLADTADKDMSFLFEQRLFWLEVTCWQDAIREKVNHNFQTDVKDLPEVFHKDENRGQFQDFFNTWGHFVVVGAYGGGSVNVGVSMSASGITIREKR